MINVLRKIIKRVILAAVIVFVMNLQYDMTTLAAEISVSDNAVPENAITDNTSSDNGISDNSMTDISVSDNSVPAEPEEPAEGESSEDATDGEAVEVPNEQQPTETVEEEPVETAEETLEEVVPEAEQSIDSNQLQTINYQNGILADWQQITEALSTLIPENLSDTAADASVLMLQLKNVTNIPAEIKNALATTDGSGRTKLLHCNVGYGSALVFSGSSDNSGFNGISNASATVYHEKRGKRSMATTVRFASHENLGAVVSLHVNLPQCEEGTKVSVYAETISVDADGNVTVGENVCIGTTKADANGNVEVPIQSTANYMFVYKEAKE